MIRGSAGIVVLLALAVALAGCSDATPNADRSVSPTFQATTTKAELLDRAESAYRGYLEAVQAISEHKNSGYSRLRPYLAAKAYSVEVESFDRQKSTGIHTTGKTRLVKFVGQKVDVQGGFVVAYACVDLSAVRVLNATNEDITPRSRPNRQTSLASFETDSGRIVLKENGTWSGDSIC